MTDGGTDLHTYFFAPPQGLRGRGKKTHPLPRTKFDWISSSGLGGDCLTVERTDGQMVTIGLPGMGLKGAWGGSQTIF